MEFLKKNKKFITWALIITLIIIPLVIQGVINWDTMNNGSDDGWLGFWGGYLGSIIGVVGALIVIQIQLSNEKERFEEETETRNLEFEEEKKVRKSEQVDNTFFNLLNLFISQQNMLVSEYSVEQNIFEDMLTRIWLGSEYQYIQETKKIFYSRKTELLSVLNNAIESSEAFIREKEPLLSEEEVLIIERVKSEGRSMTRPKDISNDNLIAVNAELQRIFHINDFKEKIEKDPFLQMIDFRDIEIEIGKIVESIDNIIAFDEERLQDEDSIAFLINFKKELNEYKQTRPNIELTIEKKRFIVELAQEPYRAKVGSYFRIFHRIIKYLNENVNDREIKKNYIGFLRANMNENQMAMIFYNINYTHRGSGAIEELKGTSFFGEKDELSDMESAHFFSAGTLVWGNDDLKKMQEFC
ncbi:putative phage abortive infection protein [Enterococcus casseliflavus]|uniref:putative phage abortive infection protein n=1 Tax=Enterococcus casseliflavus TaxID=37734 RepID=UPI003D0DA1A1